MKKRMFALFLCLFYSGVLSGCNNITLSMAGNAGNAVQAGIIRAETETEESFDMEEYKNSRILLQAVTPAGEASDMLEYKNSVGELKDSLYDMLQLVMKMLLSEAAYVKEVRGAGGTPEYERVAAAGFEGLRDDNVTKEDMEKKFDDVCSLYIDMCSLYKEIALSEVYGKEAEELYSEAKDLFLLCDGEYGLAAFPVGDFADVEEYLEGIGTHCPLIERYLK